MNNHSYFFVKEEGDNDKCNANKCTGSSLEGYYSCLCNSSLDSFRYATALAPLWSVSGFASVLLWYVTIAWWFLAHQDSWIHTGLVFFPEVPLVAQQMMCTLLQSAFLVSLCIAVIWNRQGKSEIVRIVVRKVTSGELYKYECGWNTDI